MKGKLIAEGAVGKVYDNNDGTVTKVMTDDREYKLAQQLIRVKFKYVANYLSASTKFCKYMVVKEKIDKGTWDAKRCATLSKYWDDSLVNTHELFDYFNQYLKEGIKPLREYRAPEKFFSYLYTLSDTRTAALNTWLFMELCELVQELKDRKVYNIDWNPDNLGGKNGHVALFELGGAKIKKNR